MKKIILSLIVLIALGFSHNAFASYIQYFVTFDSSHIIRWTETPYPVVTGMQMYTGHACSGTASGAGGSYNAGLTMATELQYVYGLNKTLDDLIYPVVDGDYSMCDPIAGTSDIAYVDFTRTSGVTTTPLLVTCTDGIMNQDEIGIDYGGVCSSFNSVTPDSPSEASFTSSNSVTFTGIYSATSFFSGGELVLAYRNTADLGVYNSLALSVVVGVDTPYSFTELLLPNKNYTYKLQLVNVNGYVWTDYTTPINFTVAGHLSGDYISGTGTISNVAGSGTIIGVGTHFLNTLHNGDILGIDGDVCTIYQIASDTDLQCSPLTFAHTDETFSQSNSFTLLDTGSESCSFMDIGCYLRNFMHWLFIPPDFANSYFGTLWATLQTKLPFNYLAYMLDFVTALKTGVAPDVATISVPIGSSSITLWSASMLSSNPLASPVRSILSVAIYLLLIFSIYLRVITIFNVQADV